MKKFIFLLLLAGCATGPNQYEREFLAYRDYLQAEISGSRMTLEQGNYLLVQKQNELRARQGADSAAMMGLGAAMMGASGPRPIPTNTLNCQTYQRGYNGTITCQ